MERGEGGEGGEEGKGREGREGRWSSMVDLLPAVSHARTMPRALANPQHTRAALKTAFRIVTAASISAAPRW